VNLVRLASHGFPVPPGFVATSRLAISMRSVGGLFVGRPNRPHHATGRPKYAHDADKSAVE
jgi:hypothetical protein